MNKYFSGAYGFELKLDANSKKVNFPDIPLLREKRIKHIDICTDSDISKTPSGKTLLSGGYVDCSLTIREQNTQRELIKSLPITNLIPFLNRGARLFINKIIDQENCYIDYSKLNTAYLGKYLYVVVYFDYPEMWSVIRENNRSAILPFEIQLTGKKTYFPEIKELFQKSIQNIMLSFPSITSSGNNGLDISYSNDKFLTLSYKNIEFISKFPLSLLYTPNFNFALRFQNIKFDPQSSYIESVNTTENDLKSVFFNAIIDDNK